MVFRYVSPLVGQPEANITQLITALTALLSGVLGATAGAVSTYIVQSRLAERKRKSDRGAVAAMFVADIRSVNDWLSRSNLGVGVDVVMERLTQDGSLHQIDEQTAAIFHLFKANLEEIDESVFRRHSTVAGALGALAIDVAAFYSAVASLKSNLGGFVDGLYDKFSTKAQNRNLGYRKG